MGVFRFAVMGAGTIANKFCDAVSRLEGCTVAAVASKSMERARAFAADNHIPTAYDSYRDMLVQEKPDCVYIGAIGAAHYELILLCLDHKVPVLCEKTMCLTAEQSAHVFRRAREEHIFVMEAMWSRFLPAFCQTKAWMESGIVGAPVLMDMAVGFTPSPGKRERCFNKELGGGIAYDITVYGYELATFLMPGPITKEQIHVVWSDSGVDLTNHIMLAFGNATASINTSFAAPIGSNLTIYCEKGRIVLPKAQSASSAQLYDKSGTLIEEIVDPYAENGFVYEVQEVMDCIKSGKIESDVIPHADTLACAQFIDRILATK